jgi:outer membrane immunogenic protein
LAAIAVIGFASIASAADMPVKAYGAPIPVAHSWTGCYVGGIIGAKWGTSKQTYGGERAGVPDPFLPVGWDVTGNYHVNGVLGGGDVGCNYQTGNWVLGVELDASASHAKGVGFPNAETVALGANPSRRFHTEEHWLATARARLGYGADKWLWYVTAGAAWSGFDVNNEAVIVAANANRDPARVNRLGWIAGLGTEYALGRGWSLKAEVLYANFGTFHYDDSPAVNGCVQCYSMNVKMSEWISRVGFNYRFAGP